METETTTTTKTTTIITPDTTMEVIMPLLCYSKLKQEEYQVKETNVFTKGTDAEGRSKVNQYSFVKKLGEGTYGKVKLALYGDNDHKCAVKVIRKDLLKKRREMFRDEKGSQFTVLELE